MWGLTPFMRVRKREHLQLEPLVLGDPLFQRLLVSVVIKPKVGGVNVAGATAFEQFLLEPSTQALMRTIDYSDDHATKLARWMPALSSQPSRGSTEVETHVASAVVAAQIEAATDPVSTRTCAVAAARCRA